MWPSAVTALVEYAMHSRYDAAIQAVTTTTAVCFFTFETVLSICSSSGAYVRRH